MVRYRDRLDIIADVLEVAKGGARKTQIMYGANLSYKLLTRYLKKVMNMGLVRREDGSIFKLTEKGSDFLQEFYGYREHLGEVEERLSDIEYMKAMLVNKYLNDERVR
jgi:predicted transcriptional regulator